MKIIEHTSNGIFERELSNSERDALAMQGPNAARLEIASERYSNGIKKDHKFHLIAWVIGILDKEP